ncbi:hypothetical protein VNI00_000449 [Paramarasmius palmivorus]|uniref:Uncharacterized protein n=1 Tax=Paramarasmius palmivorus TaxID=297713 RepID=A0AAW0EBE6_9AGAR
MFSLIFGTLAIAATALAESHTVNLVNNCGSGNAVFLYQGNSTPRGSGTIDGPVLGGVAWIDGSGSANCQSPGVTCGAVEFSLTNPGNTGTPNSAQYVLVPGNHQFTYRMNFAFTGSCSGVGAPGPCTGNVCPGASGEPVQCVGEDVGIVITFC